MGASFAFGAAIGILIGIIYSLIIGLGVKTEKICFAIQHHACEGLQRSICCVAVLQIVVLTL